jgi:hypothetical protein
VLSQRASFPVACSPDGTLVVSGEKNTVLVWDLRHQKPPVVELVGHQGAILSVAFTPDGKRLLSGSADTTVLVWDVNALRRRLPAPEPLTAKAIAAHGERLASAEAEEAFAAVIAMANEPAHALPWLRERLRPVPLIEPAQIKKWIAQLDDDDFRVRDAARQQLRKAQDLARPALAEAAKGTLSVEARNKIEALLDALKVDPPSESRLRALRGVEVLERIGTTEARQHLKQLREGDPAASLTQQARDALARLEKR